MALHWPRGQPLLRGRRSAQRPLHLLRRRRLRGHLQDHRRRGELGRHLRRPAGAVDRLAGGVPDRSQHRLGRHRRGKDPQPHLRRAGGLQVHRRGDDLDAHGARADRAHSPARHPPDRSGHRLRLRARALLRAAARTRRLPHHGRRRELGARALRGREHGVLRHRSRPRQPAQPVRGDVAAGDSHVWPHQRRTRRRPARLARRRRELGEAQWSG